MGRGISNSEGLKVNWDQKFRFSLWRKLRWVHDLFYMKLKWFHCSHEHYDGIGKLDVFILGDSTEHLFFSLEFAKPFGSTKFSPANANMVLNFLKSERHILVWKAFVSIRLKSHLFKNHLNEPLQSAYRQRHSCETALVRAQKDVFLELDITLV